jgi:hypothetical protein
MTTFICSRCHCELTLKYFAVKRNGQRNKCCISCLDKYQCNHCPYTCSKITDMNKHKCQKPKRIINVSEVAALIGKNKHSPASVIKMKYQRPREQIHFDFKPYLDQVEHVTNTNEIIDTIIKENPQLDPSFVKKRVYTHHGNQTENYVEEWIRENMDGELTDTQKFGGINLNQEWNICGRIDGIFTCNEYENQHILEIKNRQNRLFNIIPEYEKVQVQLYMHIHKIHSAMIVQHFKDEYKVDRLQYDEDYVNNILADLIVALTL